MHEHIQYKKLTTALYMYIVLTTLNNQFREIKTSFTRKGGPAMCLYYYYYFFFFGRGEVRFKQCLRKYNYADRKNWHFWQIMIPLITPSLFHISYSSIMNYILTTIIVFQKRMFKDFTFTVLQRTYTIYTMSFSNMMYIILHLLFPYLL